MDIEGTVSVRAPARASSVPMMRTVATDLGGRIDLDLDAVSDLRMAVDEACTALVAVADDDHQMWCTFIVAADVGIEFDASVGAGPTSTLSTTGFGWRVLQTLVQDVNTYSQTGNQPRLGIRFAMKQPHT